MRKIYPLLAVLTVSSWAHAQDYSFLPEAKLADHKASTWNVGAGFTQKLLHLNGEWVNPYGIAYAKVGAFLNGDKTAGGQVGFRYPYYLTGTDKNGYYIGFYAGHLDSKSVDGDYKSRLGAGVDLAYVLLNSERISTFSVGIGAAEKLTDRNGDVAADTKPQIQFSYSLSFGL
ncbi:hypothetical protein ACT4YZ_03310 [Acinetobacter baumannii]|uniref:hypothetical protein n=1 Tax=Acinetobacter baumannii TaxID=470 RepID=UPI00233EC9D8|nr:hypothetical protein [Acinetobacter baumannii]MDV7383544.1 hypothetical protein [Acinetobacter baumannii]HAV4975103.1 hypothetical protein [Acinetobacter baumannii]